jgi:hypothetical protein
VVPDTAQTDQTAHGIENETEFRGCFGHKRAGSIQKLPTGTDQHVRAGKRADAAPAAMPGVVYASVEKKS